MEDKTHAIIRVIASLPGGGNIDAIRERLGVEGIVVPRRTLQRRLASLVVIGKIVSEGKARATRYRVSARPSPDASISYVSMDSEPAPRAREEAEPVEIRIRETSEAEEIPVTPEGEEIRRAVRRSSLERTPVGYDRDFLDRYRPNETSYLPEGVRRQLAEWGRAAGDALPAGTHARQILDRLLIDLSWNSSRLEGNTYSLLETARLLQLGQEVGGKDVQEAQMILNHKAAIELLVDEADQIGFNRYTILNLHAVLADNLLPDPRACGRIRNISVGISGTVFHPLAASPLVEECFDQILASAAAIRDPFEQSFFAMVHFPYLQPFEDVNKRVSRLAANIPLIRHNLSPLSFVDVPQRDYVDGILGVYELRRVELLRDIFVWAYRRSCGRYGAVRQSLGDPDPFRLRHRTILMGTVGEIVREAMGREAAIGHIRRRASELLPEADRDRFCRAVEGEIDSLHEGNFARYRVRPSEFSAWREGWQ